MASSTATLAMMQQLAMGSGPVDASRIEAWAPNKEDDQHHQRVPHPPSQPRHVPRAARPGGIAGVGGVRRVQIGPKPPSKPSPTKEVKKKKKKRASKSQAAARPLPPWGGAGTPQRKGDRNRAVTEAARGGIKSARTPRLPRVDPAPGKRATHAFLTRKSKGVPMKNPMPRLKVKASPLVAAINMHERGFEKRRVQYAAQRKQQRQEEWDAEELKRREAEERQRAKLASMKKQRERDLAEAFGDAEDFDRAELEVLEHQLEQKAAKRKKVKAKRAKKKNKPKPPKPVPMTKEQLREHKKKMLKEHQEKQLSGATTIQAVFRGYADRKVYAEMKAVAAHNEHVEREHVVHTVVERLVNQVEAEGIDERFDLIRQIEVLQEQNRQAIHKIDKVLVASSKTDGHWSIPWPPADMADEKDGNFPVDSSPDDWAENAGSRKFARSFVDRLLDDVVMPHAFERVRHRRKARIAAMLAGNYGEHVQKVSDLVSADMLNRAKQPEAAELEPEPEMPDMEDADSGVDMAALEAHLNGMDNGMDSRTEAELDAEADRVVAREADEEKERMFELRKLAAERGINPEDLEVAMDQMRGQEGGMASDPAAVAAQVSAAGPSSGGSPQSVPLDPEIAAKQAKIEEMRRVADSAGVDYSGVIGGGAAPGAAGAGFAGGGGGGGGGVAAAAGGGAAAGVGPAGAGAGAGAGTGGPAPGAAGVGAPADAYGAATSEAGDSVARMLAATGGGGGGTSAPGAGMAAGVQFGQGGMSSGGLSTGGLHSGPSTGGLNTGGTNTGGMIGGGAATAGFGVPGTGGGPGAGVGGGAAAAGIGGAGPAAAGFGGSSAGFAMQGSGSAIGTGSAFDTPGAGQTGPSVAGMSPGAISPGAPGAGASPQADLGQMSVSARASAKQAAFKQVRLSAPSRKDDYSLSHVSPQELAEFNNEVNK